MKKLTSNQIRSLWLKFFEERGHHQEPSSSLVPINDPTLLWINSGVAALKKYFDGSVVPEYKRITNSQKSIRTNDIESVGYTARHHTFFEMLGSFSIGDYFRESIIPWAVEILTSEKYFAIPKELLYMTYYPSDTETKDLWVKSGISEDHLIPLEGNFWEIGAGPAGPNTEVFFDRGLKYDPDEIGIDLLKNDLENDRYVEIWGIVFSQFNANPELPRSEYPLLPNKNVDTGAGLERICCVLQGVDTNFETDLFAPIRTEIEKISDKPYSGEYLISYRIIMDHLRTLVFALSDGAVFDAAGRGYVLRRLLRRASIHGDKLGIKPPFLYKLVDVVVENMKEYYFYLLEHRENVRNLIKFEEEKFAKTLISGRENLIKVSGKNKTLNGTQLFVLYDTYGLPLDLSLDFAEELGITVSTDGYNELLEEQKQRARSARTNNESMSKQSADLLQFVASSTFTYNRKHLESTIIGIFKDGVKVEALKDGDTGEIIVQDTNFYAESGGQSPDLGNIVGIDDGNPKNQLMLKVNNVQKAPNGQHLHFVEVLNGIVTINEPVKLIIDRERRLRTMRNHSATHLLQAALNEVLNTQIHQLGSAVDSEKLRFDFSYNGKLTPEQIKSIEIIVNRHISSAFKSVICTTTLENAQKQGAIAEFGDKYDKNNVRLVCFGSVSKELCGGTHVENTQDIGIFVIESEQGVAAGVRRIQATTSIGVYDLYSKHIDEENTIGSLLDSKSLVETKEKLKSLIESHNALKEENKIYSDKLSNINAKNIETQIFVRNGISVLIAKIENITRDALVKVNDDIKSRHPDHFILLFGVYEGSSYVVSTASLSAVEEGFSAGEYMKKAMSQLNGRGGGKDIFASGATTNLTRLDEVIEDLRG